MEYGVPDGNRTRVAAVKGRCPRPLDDGDAKPGGAAHHFISKPIAKAKIPLLGRCPNTSSAPAAAAPGKLEKRILADRNR